MIYNIIISMLLLIIITLIDHTTAEDPFSIKFLSRFRFSHMSAFSSETRCPDFETHFVGARVRTAQYRDEKYRVITAMEFLCSDRVRLTTFSKPVFVLEMKDLGEWGEVNECPLHRFVSGIKLHLQSFQSDVVTLEDEFEASKSRTFGNIFGFGRTRFISGITLHCEYESGESLDYRNTMHILFGHTSGIGLSLMCKTPMVASSINVTQEAIIGVDEERALPVQLEMKCSRLFNPSIDCQPEMVWEQVKEFSCTDSVTQKPLLLNNEVIINITDAINVWCELHHETGTSLNQDIENIDQIRSAYEAANLESPTTLQLIIHKFTSSHFQKAWTKRFKLPAAFYDHLIDFSKSHMSYAFGHSVSNLTFGNLNYEAPNIPETILHNGEEVKHEFLVWQLGGVCGLYKMDMPLFKPELRAYTMREINKRQTKIIFNVYGGMQSATLGRI